MNHLLIAALAMGVSTAGFGDAPSQGSESGPAFAERGVRRAQMPGEGEPKLETQLDRCFLGQPERFSEPP